MKHLWVELDPIFIVWNQKFHLPCFLYACIQQQQQLSHLSQVFGVGYMNQKRITPDRAHGSAFSTHGSAFSTHSYMHACTYVTNKGYVLKYL